MKKILLLLFIASSISSFAQVCDSLVPTFNVDLRGQPSGSYTVGPLGKAGFCCSASGVDRCIHFSVQLDSQSVGLRLNIIGGAIPPGALFYQVDCGPLIPINNQTGLGDIACIGAGVHDVTFCKPGNNINTYTIQAVAGGSTKLSVDINPGQLFLCSGGNDIVCGTITGGIPPFTYTWRDGANTVKGITPCISVSNPDVYKIVVTDSSGCPTTDSVEVLALPRIDAIQLSTTNVLCYGDSSGSICIDTVIGGAPPFTYSWSPTFGSTACLQNVSVGNYCVVVTDMNGCTADTCVTITQPPALLISIPPINIRNVTCYGGTDGCATITPTGGTPPYTYSWSFGATTDSACGLAAGNYSVLVTDSNGCIVIANVTITQPPKLVGTPVILKGATCDSTGGCATVTVSGGIGPYYIDFEPNPIMPQPPIDTACGLSPGPHYFLIMDNNGCMDSILFTLAPPTPPTVSVSPSSRVCSGTCMKLNASSPTAVSYKWIPIQALSNPNISNPIACPLITRTYTVTVTDANNCIANKSVTITVDKGCVDPPPGPGSESPD